MRAFFLTSSRDRVIFSPLPPHMDPLPATPWKNAATGKHGRYPAAGSAVSSNPVTLDIE